MGNLESSLLALSAESYSDGICVPAAAHARGCTIPWNLWKIPLSGRSLVPRLRRYHSLFPSRCSHCLRILRRHAERATLEPPNLSYHLNSLPINKTASPRSYKSNSPVRKENHKSIRTPTPKPIYFPQTSLSTTPVRALVRFPARKTDFEVVESGGPGFSPWSRIWLNCRRVAIAFAAERHVASTV